MGRGRDNEYYCFCVDHVRQYNATYNYFDGMSDTEVKAFAVRPLGCPSPPHVVTTVTPVAKWPRIRRNSSAGITRVL